jgi:hypothetical protein
VATCFDQVLDVGLEAGFVDFGTVVCEGGDKGHHNAAEGCHFGGCVEGCSGMEKVICLEVGGVF